ncbi:glucosaminidase domain-containing protein [Thalassolituus hydrocarboniclasticus]|uniref:Glucosaminidase domain-containing protein n=1 Tax=Thalassolituus hydrocarboniclasticus TaxID=2742796 RepID=A0ABY6A8U4_9GAMM|nr:glucosaminidase domain-containing protein [Thalassolituus hydrocarboniclasticus]UXD87033.1 glucosaminidase domain-containing protein [Thalassolituus hydrocarboniclasticus]
MLKYFVFIIIAGLSGCSREDVPPNDTQASVAAVAVQPLPDFTVYQDVTEKKKAFFTYLMPLIEEANTRILAERQVVEKWFLAPEELTERDRATLQELLVKYRVNTDDEDEQKELLLLRVNTIPPSLVLAQAANESAWGTSRFAQEGNNLFGQWCFREGCGLVPEARGGSSRHEVRTFESPLESVESYMRNLNSHPRYRELRELRENEIEQQGYASGKTLSEGLQGYSIRGQEYIDEIRNMIEHNKLNRYDQQPLQENLPAGQQPVPRG